MKNKTKFTNLVSFRLPHQTIEQLKLLAEVGDQTKTGVLVRMIEREYQKVKGKEPAVLVAA